jgi:hypothetical protein
VADRTLLARNARALIEQEYDAGRQATALRRLSLQTLPQRPDLREHPEAVA